MDWAHDLLKPSGLPDLVCFEVPKGEVLVSRWSGPPKK